MTDLDIPHPAAAPLRHPVQPLGTPDDYERLRLALSAAHLAVLDWDVSLGIVTVDDQFEHILGYSKRSLTVGSWIELIHPDDRITWNFLIDDHATEYRMRHHDGSWVWVLDRGRVAERTADGTTLRVVSTLDDITSRKSAELLLRQKSAEMTTITEHIGDVVLHLEDTIVRWASPSIAEHLDGSTQLWLGIDLADHVHPDDRATFAQARRRLDSGRRARSRLRIRDLAGTHHWMDVVSTPSDDSDVHSAVLSMRAIDDDVAREGDLRRMAGSDGLTGLPNRRELMNRLSGQLLGRSTGGKTAVLFCDVDNLKQVNDQYGHAVGDAMLIVLARRMQSQIRPDDMCARFGGDEFVIVLNGITSMQAALSVAERVRAATAEPISAAGAVVSSSLSIGVAIAGPREQPGPLIKRADAAMYEAKTSGRNQVAAAAGRG